MGYSRDIDKKWQKKWEEIGLYSFNREKLDKKLYCLEMFSYPSGANLHVGHWYNFGLADSWSRMKRMQGYNIFHPQGFDAFGLPAENYAIKTGIHPKDSTYTNIETMRRQLKAMGATFDWDYELITCDPEYYKWTQWIFLQLYKNDLAYRKNAPVNWCPSCKTVLANEQVVDGECERCHHDVMKKNLTQWFFSITKYAQELLDCLDDLDWPEKTKKIQTNWIGRSEGTLIDFNVENTDINFGVFTTRADTVYGITYVVLAPEHDLVDQIVTPEQKGMVEEYRAQVNKVSEIDRLSSTREKTGVFTGAYAIHPLTGKRVQIWVADYVLAGYGTGCVMAVPAHDYRDHEFATKYDLDIIRVIKGQEGVDDTIPFVDDGILTNSEAFDGLSSEQARLKIVEKLSVLGKGQQKVTYRLRDWLVSRQRYWGAPIPIVHCEHCGAVPVPEHQLPVELPYNVVFTPDGESPLSKCDEFINTTCPTCGKPAKRDSDTLDTFVCSSWYFLRYPDNRNSEKAFDTDWINKILPVDKYVGGAEHAAMHLLYARFFTKALRDIGYLNFDEPFLSLVHQGSILGVDGQKMSKSRGNTVTPDEYIEKYGSDVFRMYLAFGFAYIEGGPWSDEGIKAIDRFVGRIERIVQKMVSERDQSNQSNSNIGADEKELNFVRNYTIKSVTHDTEQFQFNTSIARLMELVNAIYKYDSLKNRNLSLLEGTIEDLIKLISPFAPHFAEELWQLIGKTTSVFNEQWPEYDEKALVKDEVELAVQINGQVKFRINVSADATNKEIEELAINDSSANAFIEGKNIVKVIVVKGRLVNIVVK